MYEQLALIEIFAAATHETWQKKSSEKLFYSKNEMTKVCRTQTFIRMMEMQPLTCLNKRSWHCFHPKLVKVLAHALHVVWRYLNTKSFGEIEILLIQADGMLNKQTLGFRIGKRKFTRTTSLASLGSFRSRNVGYSDVTLKTFSFPSNTWKCYTEMVSTCLLKSNSTSENLFCQRRN